MDMHDSFDYFRYVTDNRSLEEHTTQQLKAMKRDNPEAAAAIDEMMRKSIEIARSNLPKTPAAAANARVRMLGSSHRWAADRMDVLGEGQLAEHQGIADCITYNLKSNAATWFVPKGTVDLVDFASKTVPLDMVLQPEMVVNPCGVAFFEDLIVRPANDDGDEYHYAALMWSPVNVDLVGKIGTSKRTEVTKSGLLFCVFAWGWKGWSLIGDSHWLYGEQLDDRTGEIETRYLAHRHDRQLAAALWLLSSQEKMMDFEDEMVPRAAQRRAKRAGVALSPVRVLQLRQRHSKTDGTGEPSKVNWSHRWIVDGFWRKNQPYGPRNSLRRPVWIAPYIKGPSDKPLDVRPTVKVL